jgi:predicted small integral membrane protein
MNKVIKVLRKFFKETKVGQGLVSAGVGVVEGVVPGVATFMKPNVDSDLGLTKKGEIDKIRLAIAMLPIVFITLAAVGLVPEEISEVVLEYVEKLLS